MNVANIGQRERLFQKIEGTHRERERERELFANLPLFELFCHSDINLITASTISFSNLLALFRNTFRDLTTEILKNVKQ